MMNFFVDTMPEDWIIGEFVPAGEIACLCHDHDDGGSFVFHHVVVVSCCELTI